MYGPAGRRGLSTGSWTQPPGSRRSTRMAPGEGSGPQVCGCGVTTTADAELELGLLGLYSPRGVGATLVPVQLSRPDTGDGTGELSRDALGPGDLTPVVGLGDPRAEPAAGAGDAGRPPDGSVVSNPPAQQTGT